MDINTRRFLILDALAPLQAVRLSGELASLTKSLSGVMAPLQRVKVGKRIAEIVAELSPEKPADDAAPGYTLITVQEPDKFWAGEKTVWVSEAKAGEIKAQIASYAKRARKLGVPEITIKETGERFVRWYVARDSAKMAFALDAKPAGNWLRTEHIQRQVSITVTGQLPQLSGWKFSAKIEHEKGGNIVKSIDGKALPTEYLTAGSYCDQCHTKRDRSATFVVRHKGSGEVKRIGSSCLKDFTGHGNAESMASLAEWQSNFVSLVEAEEGYPDDDEGGGGGRFAYIDLPEFLAAVAMCIRSGGWVPASGGDDGGMSTKDAAMSVISPGWKGPFPTEEDREKAGAAVAWAEAIPIESTIGNTFLNNCRVMAVGGAFRYRNAGIAAAIMRAYQRELDAKKAAEITGESTWQGKEGERSTFNGLFVDKVIASEGQYGYTYIHKMRDPAGNVFSWFCSSYSAKLEEGKTYNVTASVKKHDDYKGVKQTVITRAKAEEVSSAN